MSRAASRPTGRWFNDHLLYVLGKLTNCQPHVGVDMETVVRKVLEVAGVNASNPPWSGPTPTRLVTFSHRNMREGYTTRWMTILNDDGTWALSWLGAQKARTIREEHLPRWSALTVLLDHLLDKAAETRAPAPRKIEVVVVPNLTAQWVEKQGPPLISRLNEYIGNRFTTSREQDMVEEHVQTFLQNLIARDSLRTRIEAGERIPISKICVYARNSVNSQIRDNSRRPIHRILQGARTKKERASYVSLEDWANRVYVKGGVSYQRDEEGDMWVSSMDLHADESSTMVMEERVAFEEGYETIRSALKRQAPSQADEYMQLLEDRHVLEMTIRECAEKRGITPNKATTMLRDARDIVVREYEQGSLAQDLGRV